MTIAAPRTGGSTPATTAAVAAAAAVRADAAARAFVTLVGPVPLFVDVNSGRSKHDFAKWRKVLCDVDAPQVVEAWTALHKHLIEEAALRGRSHNQSATLDTQSKDNHSMRRCVLNHGDDKVEDSCHKNGKRNRKKTSSARPAGRNTSGQSTAQGPGPIVMAGPHQGRQVGSGHDSGGERSSRSLHQAAARGSGNRASGDLPDASTQPGDAHDWESAKIATGRAIIARSLDPSVIGTGKSTNVGRQIKSCIEDSSSKKNRTATFGSVANVMLRVMDVVQRFGGDRGVVGALGKIARSDRSSAVLFHQLASAFSILQCDLDCAGNILGSDWLIQRAGRAVAEIVFCAANASAVHELLVGRADESLCAYERPLHVHPYADRSPAAPVAIPHHGCGSTSIGDVRAPNLPSTSPTRQKRTALDMSNDHGTVNDGKRAKSNANSIVSACDRAWSGSECPAIPRGQGDHREPEMAVDLSPPDTPPEPDEFDAFQSDIASYDSVDLEAVIERLAGFNPPKLSAEVLNLAYTHLSQAFSVFRGGSGARTYQSREVENFLQGSDPREELEFLRKATVEHAAGWKSAETQIDVRNFCGGACDGNLEISYLFIPWKVVDKLIIGYVCRHAIGCTPFDLTASDQKDTSRHEVFEIGRFCTNQGGELTMIMKADGNRARVVHARHDTSCVRFHSKTVCDLKLLRENKWKDAVRQHTPGRCYRACITCKRPPTNCLGEVSACKCKVPSFKTPRHGSDFQMLRGAIGSHAGDYTGEGKHLFRANKVGVVHADVMTNLQIWDWNSKEEQNVLLVRLRRVIQIEVDHLLMKLETEDARRRIEGGDYDAESLLAIDEGLFQSFFDIPA